MRPMAVTAGSREPKTEPLGRRVRRQRRRRRRAVVKVIHRPLVQLVHRLARQRVGHLDGFLQRSLVRRFDRFHRCQLFLLTSGDGQGAETREGI